jgi:glycosyltransferase involved in cell wall biosynthesis
MKDHILLLSNAYFPNRGGIENSLYHLAKSYQVLGYQVDILVGDVNQANSDVLPEFEVLEGISVHRFGAYSRWRRYPVLRSVIRFKSMWNKLNALTTNKTVGIVSRFHDTTVIAKLATKLPVLYLVPGVVRVQDKASNTADKNQNLVQYCAHSIRLISHDLVQQCAFRMADSLLVFSNNMKLQVEACFLWSAPQIGITKPGVDCARFTPIDDVQKARLRKNLAINTNHKLVLGVGRLVKAKGFHFLIESLTHCDDTTALILGDGPLRAELEQLAHKLGVAERVIFKGVVDNPQQYYQTADAFAMTSTYEPLGQIVLEAIASGLPVVAFSKNAMPQTATEELLDQTSCVFVEDATGEAFAKGINIALGDSHKSAQLKKNSRALAMASFDWTHLATVLKATLEQVKKQAG